MRHAVLGAGGIGGLVGGALARGGHEVFLLMRPAALAAYGGLLRIDSRVLGQFEVPVPGVSELPEGLDVLWVTVKSNQLEDALYLAPAGRLGGALVVPLLNGVDHVQRLRAVFGDRVVPGAIRGESERVSPGHVVQTTPFADTQLAPPHALSERAAVLAADLNAAGLPCTLLPGQEALVLWGKLAILCPLALATSSLPATLGG
ncbi:MAG: ketopantoate reductase family protein, partial [Candidatus Dormibacteraeota bacterium]|nr:ketopantoate reductase family protein [Candidatus Dormibacteraeota bacterium]